MKKKVLFILHLPPPIHGSAIVGQYIKTSLLINCSIDGIYINLSTSNSIESIGKSGIQKCIRYLSILAKAFYNCIFHRPDLVYITLNSHGLGLLKDASFVLICRLLGLPHLYHFHNKGVKVHSGAQFYNWFYHFIFMKGKVILLSPLLYSDIAGYVSPSRIYYCANGIPDIGFIFKPKDNLGNQCTHLLFLSNLLKSKGIFDLFEACRLLKHKNVDFQLTIAGGEGEINSTGLINLIKLNGLEANVRYIGKVYGENKKKVFRDADVFIHPTHEDCFPLVLLEAMQAGLPIVTTFEGAIPEIVDNGKNGLIVPAHHPNLLAEAIFQLCIDFDKREQMGNAGRQKFEQHYTLEKFENRFVQLINLISNTN